MAGIKAWLRSKFGKSVQREQEDGAAANLFKKPETAPVEEVQTEPTPEVEVQRTWEASGVFSVGWRTDVGHVRNHNEDALFSLTTTLANNASNLPFGLYIVADGMGGHQHGEIASEIATRAMAEYVIRNLFTPLFSVSQQSPAESLQEILTNGVNAAHDAKSLAQT